MGVSCKYCGSARLQQTLPWLLAGANEYNVRAFNCNRFLKLTMPILSFT